MRSLTAAPPSTRRAGSLVPVPAAESCCMASRASATWKAMLSRAARAMWPGWVLRLRPIIMPLACGSQWGAPRPTKAGTKTTPSESGTELASNSISAEELTSLRLSRSHWTTAPPMKMLPSRAYSRRRLALAARVVMRRFLDWRKPAPMFWRRKQPVP